MISHSLGGVLKQVAMCSHHILSLPLSVKFELKWRLKGEGGYTGKLGELLMREGIHILNVRSLIHS